MAFITDIYALRIVGRRVSKAMHTDFVLVVLEQALYVRQPDRDRLLHHSDRGSQYVSNRYTERLAEADIAPSDSGKPWRQLRQRASRGDQWSVQG